MTADKRVKSVAFNVKNPEEKDLWKHVSRRNFSGYVKRLIAEDIKRKEAIKQPQNDAKKPQQVRTSSQQSPRPFRPTN
jgi:hypothetical protein